MKKGYVFILLFALLTGLGQAYKYRKYVAKDFDTATGKLIIQAVSLFLIVLIPGLFAVRWYYKKKAQMEENNEQ